MKFKVELSGLGTNASFKLFSFNFNKYSHKNLWERISVIYPISSYVKFWEFKTATRLLEAQYFNSWVTSVELCTSGELIANFDTFLYQPNFNLRRFSTDLAVSTLLTLSKISTCREMRNICFSKNQMKICAKSFDNIGKNSFTGIWDFGTLSFSKFFKWV